MNHENNIKNNIIQLDETGKVKSRENTTLEFKETFNIGSSAKYAKTMASFANNVGGYIIFGVKDRPRQLVGVNSAFFDLKVEKLTSILNANYSPEIIWDLGTVKVGEQILGYIYVEESEDKPIMAIKNDTSEKICEGDIFYRYKARTERIKFPEMSKILATREKKIQDHILKLIEMARSSNTTNIGIVNYSSCRITTPSGVDVAIDKNYVRNILRSAKYIKEGSFDDNGGQPVLKITGNIELAEGIPVPDFDPDDKYKYLQKDLAEKLCINRYDVEALIWHYKLKEEKKYHMSISLKGDSKMYRYSTYALQLLEEKIEKHKNDEMWLIKIRQEYAQHKNGKRKKKGGENNG